MKKTLLLVLLIQFALLPKRRFQQRLMNRYGYIGYVGICEIISLHHQCFVTLIKTTTERKPVSIGKPSRTGSNTTTIKGTGKYDLYNTPSGQPAEVYEKPNDSEDDTPDSRPRGKSQRKLSSSAHLTPHI